MPLLKVSNTVIRSFGPETTHPNPQLAVAIAKIIFQDSGHSHVRCSWVIICLTLRSRIIQCAKNAPKTLRAISAQHI